MSEPRFNLSKWISKQVVSRLLHVSSLQFAVCFLAIAVIVSVLIVLSIDILWDGRFSPELEFAGVVTPFLDGLFLVVFIIAMFDEIREEVRRRKEAEESLSVMNTELEIRISKRTRQLIETQEELVRKEKLAMLGLIAGGMGNELRNPLGVMHNAVFYLKNIMPDADVTVREYLDIIDQEVTNSQQIISDLHDFTRLKPPRIASLSIPDLVRQSLTKCAIPRDIAVELQLPETLPMVRADSYQIGLVLQNILSNAVQAMAGGGRLAIRGDKHLQGVRISISDTGEGIAVENRGKIFEPLFTTKSRGIGLGLALAKKYLETSGGSIMVESEVGQGTTFSIVLPVEENR